MRRFMKRRKDVQRTLGVRRMLVEGGVTYRGDGPLPEHKFETAEGQRWHVRGGLPLRPLGDATNLDEAEQRIMHCIGSFPRFKDDPPGFIPPETNELGEVVFEYPQPKGDQP